MSTIALYAAMAITAPAFAQTAGPASPPAVQTAQPPSTAEAQSAATAAAAAPVPPIAPPDAPQPAAPEVAAPADTAAPTVDINAYDVDGNTLLDDLSIEKAVYDYLGPKRTAADVEKARAALEQAYKARGYQSVVVEIPPQEPTNGIVKLHVTEAAIGRLRVVGSRYHAPSDLKKLTPSLAEGQVPDLDKAQKEVAQLGRYPSTQITPILKPGKIPGTVDVDLKVKDQLPLTGSVELNNDHAQSTSDLRLVAGLSYDNLWQLGHTVSFTYIGSPQNISDVRVLYGAYLAPIFNSPWSIQVSGYTSNSKTEILGGTSVLGDGYQVGVRGVLQLPTFGSTSQSITFGPDYKNFKQTFQVAQPDGSVVNQTVPIDYVPLTAAYSLQHFGQHATAIAAASVTWGVRGLGSDLNGFQLNRADASENFVHANLSLDYTHSLPHGFNIQGRFAGQLADQPLLTNEQFAIGGFGTVRGFLQTEALGDDGIFGSAELRSPSFSSLLGDWVDELRLYTFLDAGKIWVLDVLPEQQPRITLYSAGAGVRVQLLRHLSGDVLVAVPLRDGPVSQAGDPRVTFSVKTEF